MLSSNQNIAGLSKPDSTLNDGKSIEDSYGDEGSLSEEDDMESQSGSRKPKE